MNSIQIIIPVYRDRELLNGRIPGLLRQNWKPEQITVVDAGGENQVPIDNSWGIQVLHVGANLRGRARQMNHGAARSRSDALLFLHADTRLPDGASSQIQEALSTGAVGGGFERQFEPAGPLLRFTCRIGNLRARYLGWYFGDQAIFCKRDVFSRIGGFPDMQPFEDLSFARLLKQQGPLIHLRPGITSSSRRFRREGPLIRTLKDTGWTLRYFFKHPTAKSLKK